jgi:hypothetical protein
LIVLKKHVYIGLAAFVMTGIIFFQQRRINVITEDRDTYKKNTYSLLSDIEHYKVADSLQVVSIDELILTVKEYEQYRQEDMALIKSLKVDKNRLQKIISAQTATAYELSGVFRDSIVYLNSYDTDTLRCVDINEKWFDLHGCIDTTAKFTGTFESRDSLLYVEHVIPKRFWFIKWGVKERRQEIVSRNPYTRIEGAEFVTVRK